jgi:hypothetical protein
MEADEREIRQVVAKWMTATKAGDIETVLTLMADDVVFLVQQAERQVGAGTRCQYARPRRPGRALATVGPPPDSASAPRRPLSNTLRIPPPGKFGPVSDWVCPTGPREVMGPHHD